MIVDVFYYVVECKGGGVVDELGELNVHGKGNHEMPESRDFSLLRCVRQGSC